MVNNTLLVPKGVSFIILCKQLFILLYMNIKDTILTAHKMSTKMKIHLVCYIAYQFFLYCPEHEDLPPTLAVILQWTCGPPEKYTLKRERRVYFNSVIGFAKSKGVL